MESYNDNSEVPLRGSPPYAGDGSPGTALGTPSSIGQKRKRPSPGPSDQEEQGEEHGNERTRHVPKRACNECRQQKVRDHRRTSYTACAVSSAGAMIEKQIG